MSALAGAWTEGGSTITFHFGMGMYCFLTSVLAPQGCPGGSVCCRTTSPWQSSRLTACAHNFRLHSTGRVNRTEQRPRIAMVLDSTAIAYPYRRHTRRSARRQSSQHGGPDPNFRAYSVRAGTPAAHPFRLCRSEEHTSELQSRQYLVCRLLLEKKKK